LEFFGPREADGILEFNLGFGFTGLATADRVAIGVDERVNRQSRKSQQPDGLSRFVAYPHLCDVDLP
jgi:hypothetical protein